MQQFTVLYCQWVVVNLHCNERAFLCLSIYIVLFNIKFKSFKLKSSWVMLFCMHRHLFLVKKIYLDTIFFLPETSACRCMIFVHYVVVFSFFFLFNQFNSNILLNKMHKFNYTISNGICSTSWGWRWLSLFILLYEFNYFFVDHNCWNFLS
jgi:hypothetical protein